MLRIFFSVLALVAMAITLFALGPLEMIDWWKYIPAGGLIAIAIILWIVAYSPTFKRKKINPISQVGTPKESLHDLGIIGIRPKSSDSDESNLNEFPYDGPKPIPKKPHESIQLSFLIDQDSDHLGESSSEPLQSQLDFPDPLDKNFFIPVLQGFKAALNVHAIGIIRSMENYKFKILATIGYDWTQAQGDIFDLKYDGLLKDSEKAAIHIVGSNNFESTHITYSRKPKSITAIGISSIGNTGNYLLVDTFAKEGLNHPRMIELLATFGEAYSLLLYRDDPNRPRHEIISEEILKAKMEKRQLAFALVAPQKAEELSKIYKDFLGEIEESLSECLDTVTKSGRVVKFGELLFGVFTDGRKEYVERWHRTLQSKISSHGGLLSGGVFIGIVIMNQSHQTGNDLRDDARRALFEAYSGPVSTVII